MTNTRVFVLAIMALVVAAAVWSKSSMNSAQLSPTAPPAATTPSPPATATPATPTPAPVTPATPAAEAPAPAAPAATTEAPATPAPATEAPPAATAPNVKTANSFGEEQTLTAKKVIILKGAGTWETAFETLVGSLKTLSGFLDKQGIKAAGPVLIVYNSTDDAGFTYQAEIPVDQDPKNLAKGMSIGMSPEGKTLKFVHRGSYDNMDNTYEAITNHLDDKKLEARDTFIEEYVTNPLTTTEDKLVINVFVPLK